MDRDATVVVVGTFGNRQEADSACSVLLANNIQGWVEGSASGGMDMQALAGSVFKLSVSAVDAKRAKEMLTSHPGMVGSRSLDSGGVPGRLKARPQNALSIALTVLVGAALLGLVLIAQNHQRSHFTGVREKKSSTTGKVDTWYFYEEGKLTRVERDRNHDGKPDIWDYYEGGQLTKRKCDNNFDGKVDAWITYKGGEIKSGEYDNNFDGKPDEWITYENGLAKEGKYDTDFNGVPDLFATFQNGQGVYEEVRPQNGAMVIRKVYFEHGNRVREEVFSETTGELVETTYFDAFMRPSKAPRIEQKDK